jgi:hypothetical protein
MTAMMKVSKMVLHLPRTKYVLVVDDDEDVNIVRRFERSYLV